PAGFLQVTRKRSRRRVNGGSRRLVLFVLVATLIVGTIVLALRPGPLPVRSPAELPEQLSLLVDGAFGARFAGEMGAQVEGFFASNITLRADRNDPDFVATVARRHAVGVTSGHKFLLAAWQGVPVIAFAASLLDASTAIFTLESSGLRRPTDLVGKRLGY